jgi:tRNA(fMet)-specific endonuclease VapC
MAGPRYLLDTNILSKTDQASDWGSSTPHRQGRRGCDLHQYRGSLQASLWAAKKGSPVLSDKIGQLLSTIEVLPLEEGADEKYAEVRTALERAGTLIGANDLLIATHALSLGLALVTDNTGEFSRVPGLGAENWLAP